MCREKIDILWIGARTTCSPIATQEIANAVRGYNIPILIKNPTNPQLDLWIGAIERLLDAGIKEIAAIHRGFYSNYSKKYKNIPNWELVSTFKKEFPDIHLICDPSHIAGKKKYVYEISQIAVNLGYVGLMIEAHSSPNLALSDSKQQLTPEELMDLLKKLNFSNINDVPTEFLNYELRDIYDTREMLSKKEESIKKLISKT